MSQGQDVIASVVDSIAIRGIFILNLYSFSCSGRRNAALSFATINVL